MATVIGLTFPKAEKKPKGTEQEKKPKGTEQKADEGAADTSADTKDEK